MRGYICSMTAYRQNSRNIKLRMAVPADAETLLDIYAPYVMETAVSFEYDVPTVDEFRKRIETILKKYPYLVAEVDGEVCGYAYASRFHVRAACEWCAESSIYACRTSYGPSGSRL